MLHHGLREGNGVLNLEAPLFDGFDIFIHTLAFSKNDWDLKNNDADFENALKDWVPASFFEGCDRKFNLRHKIVIAVIASLDLHELVISGHAIHEPSDEIGSQ